VQMGQSVPERRAEDAQHAVLDLDQSPPKPPRVFPPAQPRTPSARFGSPPMNSSAERLDTAQILFPGAKRLQGAVVLFTFPDLRHYR